MEEENRLESKQNEKSDSGNITEASVNSNEEIQELVRKEIADDTIQELKVERREPNLDKDRVERNRAIINKIAASDSEEEMREQLELI